MTHLIYRHLKQTPQDFIVEEVLPEDFLKKEGRYVVYKLEKTNLSTLQVIRFLSNKLKILPSQIGFAGLKDKYAITTQYITIPEEHKLDDFCLEKTQKGWINVNGILQKKPSFCIKKIGKSDKPLSLGNNKGNIFTITLRNINKDLKRKIYQNLEIINKYGFANYFGEQRFGSVKARNDFIFKYFLEEKIEKGLKTYFSVKYSLKNWGKWEDFYKDIKPTAESYEKDLVLGLKRGLSFEKAVRILPKNIRLMFNFAYQSFLWNETLRLYIEQRYPYKRVSFIHNWKLSFYLEVFDFEKFKNLKIPYTGNELKFPEKDLKNVFKQILKKYNVKEEWFEKEVIGIKAFTDGERNAICIPENIKIISKDKNKLKIRLFLSKGSYATVFIRKLLM